MLKNRQKTVQNQSLSDITLSALLTEVHYGESRIAPSASCDTHVNQYLPTFSLQRNLLLNHLGSSYEQFRQGQK